MSARSESGADGTKRVFLHIGAPKTGTTYLQQVLISNRRRLASSGVLFPYQRFGQIFRSSHDFCAEEWFGRPADEFSGEWEQIAERAREWSGSTVLITGELLAGAGSPAIERSLALLGPAEIHVIFSARDLSRQLVSDWQEHVKHKHTVTLETFVDDLVVLGPDAPKPFGRLFWGMHDAAHVLRIWGEHVPADRIHVVTVPQSGGRSDELWLRFCAVTGLDPQRYNTAAKRSNPSMGVVETELVRRINVEMGAMPGNSYDVLVRLFLAEKVLGGGTARLSLPPWHRAWARERSAAMIEELRAPGYPVEGELADLLPVDPGPDYVSPTTLGNAEIGPLAVTAAAALLTQAGKLHATNLQLREGDDVGYPDFTADEPPPPPTGARAGLRLIAGAGRRALGRLLRRS